MPGRDRSTPCTVPTVPVARDGGAVMTGQAASWRTPWTVEPRVGVTAAAPSADDERAVDAHPGRLRRRAPTLPSRRPRQDARRRSASSRGAGRTGRQPAPRPSGPSGTGARAPDCRRHSRTGEPGSNTHGGPVGLHDPGSVQPRQQGLLESSSAYTPFELPRGPVAMPGTGDDQPIGIPVRPAPPRIEAARTSGCGPPLALSVPYFFGVKTSSRSRSSAERAGRVKVSGCM